jgi:hypothetical protein
VIKPHPLPRLRVQIPFERSFTETEFLRLKQGIEPQSMDDRWHVFFKDPWLSFVRSWTGFCIYKVRLEDSDKGYKIAEVWVSRERRQYGGDDPREEADLLSTLINRLLVGWTQRHALYRRTLRIV